jgi:hypothetical protein
MFTTTRIRPDPILEMHAPSKETLTPGRSGGQGHSTSRKTSKLAPGSGHPPAHPHIAANLRDRNPFQTQRIAHELASEASNRRVPMITSLNDGRDEDVDGVNLLRIEERAQRPPATFNQHVRHCTL